jgi:hypothetical protein
LTQQQHTDLTITTDEGDTVSLSLASNMDAKAGKTNSGSHQDGGTAFSQTAFFESFTSRSMTVEINGDLNAAELEDIRDAITAIGGMIDDFLSGDLKTVAEAGLSLKELETISSLDATFSYERQVQYGERDTVEIRRLAPVEERRPGHGGLRRLMHRIDRITDDMAERVNGFRGRRHQLIRSIRDLFDGYRSGEAALAPQDRLEQAVIRTMQSTFAQKIRTLTESASFNLTYSA